MLAPEKDTANGRQERAFKVFYDTELCVAIVSRCLDGGQINI